MSASVRAAELERVVAAFTVEDVRGVAADRQFVLARAGVDDHFVVRGAADQAVVAAFEVEFGRVGQCRRRSVFRSPPTCRRTVLPAVIGAPAATAFLEKTHFGVRFDADGEVVDACRCLRRWVNEAVADDALRIPDSTLWPAPEGAAGAPSPRAHAEPGDRRSQDADGRGLLCHRQARLRRLRGPAVRRLALPSSSDLSSRSISPSRTSSSASSEPAIESSAAEQEDLVHPRQEALAGGMGDGLPSPVRDRARAPGRGCRTRPLRSAAAGGRRRRPGVPAASSETLSAPRPRNSAPQAAIPTAIPTWRKVSLIPDAIPLCSFGTTLSATSAITGFSRPTPTPATMKPSSRVVHSELGVDPRHQQQADAGERQPAGEQHPGLDAAEQDPGDRRDEEGRDRDRQVPDPGLERRVAEVVLQVERQVEEEREHRARDREGRDLDAGEGAAAEEMKRQHRLADPALDRDEGRQQRPRRRRTGRGSARCPSPPGCRAAAPAPAGTAPC